MNKKLNFTAIMLALAVLGITGTRADELKLIRTDTPPKIDGILDDVCWKEAAKIDTLHLIGAPDQTTNVHKIYVTFDDAWLYAAYDIQQPGNRRQAPAHLKHDDYIQRDDCVKLSFDPGTDGAVYYHFKINRANARREQRNTRTEGQVRSTQNIEGWDIPWRSAVRDHRENWTAEIAVPLCLLTPTGKLDRARINLLATRNMVVTLDETVNIAEMKNEQLSAAPLTESWDDPKHFIPVRGMETLNVQTPFLPYFKRIEVGKYREQDGRYYYDVSVKLESFSVAAGAVKLEWEDLPEDAAASIVSETVQIAAQAETADITLSVPVEVLTERTGQLNMYDVQSGELLQGEPLDKDGFGTLNTLFSAYFDRSYYTGEQRARVLCTIGLPESSLQDIRLIAKTDQGKIIAGGTDTGAGLREKESLDIPLGTIPVGTHTIAIHLIRPDESVVASQALELVKRPPNPGCEWKIDRENRIVLRNDKPFFVCGVNLPTSKSEREAAMRDIRAMGFNAVLYHDSYDKWNLDGGMDPTDTAYLDLAKQHDLVVMPWMESYVGKPSEDAPYVSRYGGQSLVSLHFALIRDKRFANMSFKERTAFWEDAVARQMPDFLTAAEHVKHHPNFLGYFIFDEPVPKKFYDQITSGREFYRKLHETDGYHPVMINYCGLGACIGEEYVDWCDVLAVDPYWVPPGRPNRVSRETTYAWKRAQAKRNPIWIIPCPEYWSFIYKRVVGPQENLCQTYLALIHGAKGLWYFTYNFRWQFTVDGFKTINEQLKVLAPMVLSPSVEQVLNKDKGIFTDIQATLFRNPEGGFVMLAANRCPYPVDATFTLSNLSDKEEMRQLFDKNWSAVVKDASFHDTFESFGVRAYVIPEQKEKSSDSCPQPAVPVQIAVAMEPHPDVVTPEPLIPATGRAGKRNLVQNPGFELMSLPGFPDYYPTSGYVGKGKGPRFGLPGASLELDSTQPFEGKYCLKLICRKPRKTNARDNFLHFRLEPPCTEPTPFVFSAYMRADKDGAKAYFSGPKGFGRKGSWVPLTKEWKRYYVTDILSPGPAARAEGFRISVSAPWPDECTAWIDAVQVEQGTEPTAYEP